MANEKLDLIDRKTLLRRLQKRREDFASAWKTPDAMPANAKIQYHENLVCAIIVEDAPTVDAVPVVHGTWLYGSGMSRDGSVVYESIDCSVCEEVFKIESHDRKYWKNRFKNCPFCGAKMDGGNEDG